MRIADIDFCTPSDIDELALIESLCFEQPWDRRVLEHDLANLGEVIYLKALVAGRVAGYGVLARNGAAAHLLNIAVRPDCRSQGIGLQLMFSLGEIASEWGCGRMRLEVRSANAAARDFYSKLGFAHIKRVRGYYANGDDALVMVARLPMSLK
ncbi:MAG: ribosomal protein S18-alanine N-acetyltransferase [Synergistaceae bacterium]|nr:ribosomal protein S18-alanine N-acetyltransferase [Synergistaceae bacterium]